MAIRSAEDALSHPSLAEAVRRKIIKIDENRITYTLNHERTYNWTDPEEWVRAVTVAWLIIDRNRNRVRSFFLHQSPLASVFTIPRHMLLQDLTLSPLSRSASGRRSGAVG
jgi:hypothetical protein